TLPGAPLICGFFYPTCAPTEVKVMRPQCEELTCSQAGRCCQKEQRSVLFSTGLAKPVHLADVVGNLLRLGPRERHLSAAVYLHLQLVTLRNCEPALGERRLFVLRGCRENSLHRAQDVLYRHPGESLLPLL